jgi:hypothetical protein
MTPTFFSEVICQDPRFSSPERCADLALLEPITREAVEAVIEDAREHGVILMPWETYRSRQRQLHLFLQGASHLREVGVHHYGLACDLVKSIAGEPSWKGDFGFLGVLAKQHGLVWGGDWGNPGIRPAFVDSVHVQRIKVRDQANLFRGDLYPGATYAV